MSEKISPKIQRKINHLVGLQSNIKKWKEKSEDEVYDLIKEFEKIPRDEISLYYTPYLTNIDFACTLLEIACFYSNNQKIILNIISSLGNMILRYHLPETEDIYNFILDNSTKKNLSAYVSIYLPKLKGFENYPNKWQYFMSMKKMAPKKIAQQQLVDIIEKNTENIPNEYKEELMQFLKEKHDLANNEYGKKMYLDMINKIKK